MVAQNDDRAHHERYGDEGQQELIRSVVGLLGDVDPVDHGEPQPVEGEGGREENRIRVGRKAPDGDVRACGGQNGDEEDLGEGGREARLSDAQMDEAVRGKP